MAALLDLRMPGVYTQEIPTLPPTVGVIPSAIPVFIGYTEKAEKKGESLSLKPTRVKSMKEFEDWFGGPEKVTIQVDVDERASNPLKPEARVVKPVTMKFKMYHSMLFYYANGGGPCFIMSVGSYKDAISADGLKSGIAPLKKVRDITILVFPDGTSLDDAKYASVITEALSNHCVPMKNRVTVIDVNDTNGEDQSKFEKNFENNMPNDIEIKKYGMAYYPFVDTIFSYAYNKDQVTVRNHLQDLDPAVATQLKNLTDAIGAARTEQTAAATALAAVKKDISALTFLKKALEDWNAAQNPAPDNNAQATQLNTIATDSGQEIPAAVKEKLKDPMPDPVATLGAALTDNTNTKLPAATAAADAKKAAVAAAVTAAGKGVVKDGKTFISYSNTSLDVLETANNMIFGKIKDAISQLAVTLPPCGAVAGIYVRTDVTKGVWQAPANVSVFAGIKPTIEIDDDLHASLNAPTSGKAINVIRPYPGRGLLVYGARTLAGNDLEWRYVNVRRTFCFIEDSVARAMQDFVFEPNNQQTWIKVRAMIRSFLNRLWKAGGLYGNTPEDAYEVVVGEPESMSVEEMLSGIMRIFIKVAVARPAEFIVLQYEHKFELVES